MDEDEAEFLDVVERAKSLYAPYASLADVSALAARSWVTDTLELSPNPSPVSLSFYPTNR